MSINANSSGSMSRVTPPAIFSWVLWWKWLDIPSNAFHTIWSVDDTFLFNSVSSNFGGNTPIEVSCTGPAAQNIIDPGLNWVCLAGINPTASGSTFIFLARLENERYWSQRVTLTSASGRTGDLFLFDESAHDQPSNAIMKGYKIWSEAKTENMLLRESFQLDPMDSTALWAYPEMRSVAGAGRDMRSTGRAFTPVGTFVADGREPPVREQFHRQTGWLRGGLRA